ncbi:MAG: hypothetical protein IPK82_32130 [Polyangiaceae bacterium]|nr:hypothetical protein [Polyangiaceae bacterium]
MRLSPIAFALAALTASRAAFAQPLRAPNPAESSVHTAGPAPVSPASSGVPSAAQVAQTPDFSKPLGPTYHLAATLFFGDGLRFNNPYRLKSQLGESAKTVSVTAPYVDFGIALAVGNAFGLKHGAALNLTTSLAGVSETLLVPAYTAMYRGTSHRFLAFGRLGPAIILAPSPGVGGELGVGGAVYLTAKTAFTAEVIGNLFYGAATKETGYPVYPVVSLQVGLLLDHEVFPQ